ncbi:MAG TPA: hypothetical protein VFJ47_05335, partial [Terriglobales bacterium]|nr:hypothetical protein [Terriglobales bacterium]
MRLLLTLGAHRKAEIWRRSFADAFAVALVTCFLVTGAVASDCLRTDKSTQVVWQEQRLTVCANKVPVSTLIREIAKKTGVRVVGLNGPLGVISIQLDGAPEFVFPRLL